MRSGPVRTLVILSLLAIGPGISAQPSERLYRVGWLTGGSPPAWTFPPAEALRQRLRDRGYVEGRNLVFEFRYAEGRFDRFPKLAADLVQQRVDIIFAAGDQAIKAAKQATSTTPIVMVACDAVAAGLIDTLARPGGNVSGVTCVSVDIAGKRLELLRDLLGRVTRVAVLYNTNDPGKAIESRETETAARALAVQAQLLPVWESSQLEGAFSAAHRGRADAVVVLGDGFTMFHRSRIVNLAASARLPAMYGFRQFVDSGGLISFGPDLNDMFATAAAFIDRILKGAKPADLPVEQPTRFELVINSKTARTLGLTIPPSLLLRIDQVVE